MIEAEVLATIRDGLDSAFSGDYVVTVIVGQPSRPLEKTSDEIRVIVEDGGSRDLETIDQSPGYLARVAVTVETFRDPGDAAQVREAIQRFFRGFHLGTSDLQSGPWRTLAGGWDIADAGRHRYAGIVFRSRVYSAAAIRERLGI